MQRRSCFTAYKQQPLAEKRKHCLFSSFNPLVRVTGCLMHTYGQISQERSSSYTEQTREILTDQSTGAIIMPQLLKTWPWLYGRYRFLKQLGKGGFSQMILAEDMCYSQHKHNVCSRRYVAIKIMNAKYSRIGVQECRKVRLMNRADDLDTAHIIRIFNSFYFQNHLCIVFEWLGESLLPFTTSTKARLSLRKVKKIAAQLIGAVSFLQSQGIIHADLKPENVLLRNAGKSDSSSLAVKLVDFGNAIDFRNGQATAYYNDFICQTLSYRAPEVVFGLKFGYAIDMWSIGVIVTELFIGKTLFPCSDAGSLIQSMQALLGPIPHELYSSGKLYSNYFGTLSRDCPSAYDPDKICKRIRYYYDIVDPHFLSFIQGLLAYNPQDRLTPQQAILHPFLASLFPFSIVFGWSAPTVAESSVAKQSPENSVGTYPSTEPVFTKADSWRSISSIPPTSPTQTDFQSLKRKMIDSYMGEEHPISKRPRVEFTHHERTSYSHPPHKLPIERSYRNAYPAQQSYQFQTTNQHTDRLGSTTRLEYNQDKL